MSNDALNNCSLQVTIYYKKVVIWEGRTRKWPWPDWRWAYCIDGVTKTNQAGGRGGGGFETRDLKHWLPEHGRINEPGSVPIQSMWDLW